MSEETEIPQRDVDDMYGAVKTIGAKILPDGKAYGHIARCLAVLRPHVLAGNDAREMIQKAHMPVLESAGENEEIKILDPIGMQQELGDLNRQLCKVCLPSMITDDMLPKKLKDVPQNEAALANCLGALSPWLYTFPDDGE